VGNRLKAYLVLGCNGLKHGEFVICKSVQNPIIDLEQISEDLYNTLLNFFDSACELFDSPINDYNKCVNTLSLLYRNYNAYDKNILNNIQSFIRIHKDCGIWIALILKEDFNYE
jgi:hypothetical protein